MAEGKAIYKPSDPDEPLRQGEILSNLVQRTVEPNTIASKQPILRENEHPMVAVLSQDCDLDLLRKAMFPSADDPKPPSIEQQIPNVMFCEVFEAETLYPMTAKGDEWRRISQNQHERYQFLERVPNDSDLQGEGLPELGIDFRRYFTVPADEVYVRLSVEIRRRCRLVHPYMEHLCTRFRNYQARIALPADHISEPVIK